jgi:heparan-sulfate lyase
MRVRGLAGYAARFAAAAALAVAASQWSDAEPALVFGPVQFWRSGSGAPDTTTIAFTWTGQDGEFTLEVVNGQDHQYQVQGAAHLNGQAVIPWFSEQQELIATSVNPEDENELVVVLDGPASGFVTVGVWVEGLSDESFFNLLDLERPGLEEVRERVLAGDYPGAEAALLQYMRTRELPYLPPGGASDYQAALNVVDHRFDLSGQEVHFPHDIAWNERPDTMGLQPWAELHKHTHLKALAEAYADTALTDELWAREWVSECLDWTLDCYPADPRRDTPAQIGLLVGRRVTRWLSTHQCFVASTPSASVSPSDYVGFLKSLYEQADTLCARAEWGMRTNGGIVGAGALFQCSLMLPEFQASAQWRSASEDSLAWAVDNTFYDDGCYFEESLHYHRVAHSALMVALSLAAIHDYSLPPTILTAVEREVEALMYVVKPDVYLPQIGDGDHLWCGETFMDAWEILPHRTDFLYVGTMGLSGERPQSTERQFPTGRYYAMRSDWDYRTVWVGPKPEQVSDAAYLLLTADRAVPGSHFHFDPLSVEVHAYGETVVKDPGQYGYDDPYWRDYFQATLQHNTVAIDDRDAWHYPDTTSKEWFAGPSFTSLVASHYNYYWLGVVHTRGVLFLRPWCWIISDVLTLFPGPAPMPHDFYQNWHFMPGVEPTVDMVSGTALAGHLMICQSRGSELDAVVDDSYVCLSGGALEGAMALRYRVYGTAPLAFHTLLVPVPDPSSPPTVSVQHLPAFEGGAELAPWRAAGVRVAKEDTVVFYAANHDSATQVRVFADLSTNGLVASVTKAGAGDIRRILLHRGDLLLSGDSLLVATGETAAVEWCDSIVVIEGLSSPAVGFRVWAPAAKRVRVNGRYAPFHRDGAYVVGVGPERRSPPEAPTACRLVIPSPSLGGIDLSLVPAQTRLRIHDVAGRTRFAGAAPARWLAASPGVYVVTADGGLRTKVLVVR